MRNNFAIVRESEKDHTMFLVVDTSKAVLRGMKWHDLGDFGKRKFENLLFLQRMEENRKKLKINYV